MLGAVSFSRPLWLLVLLRFAFEPLVAEWTLGGHLILLEDPTRLVVKLALFAVAAQAGPKLWVLLVAHEAGLYLAIQLLNVICAFEFLTLPEGPDHVLCVLIVAVACVSPHDLDCSVLLNNLLGEQPFAFSLDDEPLWMQQELNVVFALSKPFYQILLEIVEGLGEESHTFPFLIDLVYLRGGRILDHEGLRVELVGIELEDVLEVGPGLQLEAGILLHEELAVDAFV